MQDKHIDEVVDEKRKYGLTRLLEDFKGKEYFTVEQAVGRIEGLYKKYPTQSERLAIWNKALELVGDDEPNDGFTEDETVIEDGLVKHHRIIRNWYRRELRFAIQAEIDKIGGKNGAL